MSFKITNLCFYERNVQFVRFSLIELLVVISVIAILVTLLQPSLKNAMSSAKVLACASNEKVMASYNFLYSNDNNDEFVPSAKASGYFEKNVLSGHPANFWTYDEAFSAYDGSNLAFSENSKYYGRQGEVDRVEYRCPMEKQFSENRWQKGTHKRTYAMNRGNRGFGYGEESGQWHNNVRGISGVMGSHQNPDKTFRKWGMSKPVKTFLVPSASTTFLMAEVRMDSLTHSANDGNSMGMSSNGGFTYADSPFMQRSGQYGLTIIDENPAWHEGRWNYLFVDGHVELLYPEDTVGTNGGMGDTNQTQSEGMWTRDPND